MFWILTDYSDRSFSFNDLAFLADRLYRWSYFHWKSSFRKFIKICSFLSAQIHTTHAFGLHIITPKYKMQALFCVKSHFFIFSPIFTHITSQFHPHPAPNPQLSIPHSTTTFDFHFVSSIYKQKNAARSGANNYYVIFHISLHLSLSISTSLLYLQKNSNSYPQKHSPHLPITSIEK